MLESIQKPNSDVNHIVSSVNETSDGRLMVFTRCGHHIYTSSEDMDVYDSVKTVPDPGCIQCIQIEKKIEDESTQEDRVGTRMV